MAEVLDDRVAVVGMGALFPDATNVSQFWRNICDRRVSIAPMPEEMFESEVFYRPDLLAAINKQEKSITRMAAWIKDLAFDTVRKYKIPPSVAEHMDPNQHAALYATDQALAQEPLREVAKDRVGVIFGNGMVGINYGHALVRVQFQLIEHYMRMNGLLADKLSPAEREALIEYLRERSLRDTIPITEDDAPGILPNIIAGRIANVYDFHGPAFTLDAACASALAAIITGVQGLYLNEYDAVVCGASDMPLKQLGFIYFSALNALSPTGSFPFDVRANGFVMGQGAGTVVLKRLEDALRHNDTIYAVITGYGEASDGKGKYIAAPNEEWQAHTIEKACRMAGYPVDTIEMIEAHGTATVVGDVVEVNALKRAFRDLGATRKSYCGLTSVKSNIGHLKSAAGIAGFIKAALALHHRTLPPTASFQEINPKLALDGSPFYIIDTSREWADPGEHPRRANVSAFGFGGADYHLALEEYRPGVERRVVSAGSGRERAAAASEKADKRPDGGSDTQILLFSGADTEDLDAQVKAFAAQVRKHDEIPFLEHCHLHNYTVSAEGEARLALLAASLDEVEARYAEFAGSEPARWEALKIKGVYAKAGQPIRPAETALLFPGQASQYPHMLRSLYERYQPLRAWFTRADAHWLAHRDHTVTSLIYPPAGDEESAWERLRETQNAHPSIFITSYALYDLLHSMGLRADHMVGHSLGEITALAAAGKLSFENALRLVEQRGYAFHETPLDDPGKMIAVAGSLEQVEAHVRASGLDVSIANINGPRQIIVAGPSEQIERFADYLSGQKITHKLLYVSHAFHSPLIEPVAERFARHIADVPFRTSDVEVVMNHRGVPYPNAPEELGLIPDLLKEQMLQPVRFVDTINGLYDAGVRLFVEVGPGSVLSGLVRDILRDKAVSILTANPKGGDEAANLLKLLGALFVEGVPIAPLPEHEPLARASAQAGLAPEVLQPAAVPQAKQPAAAPPAEIASLPVPTAPPVRSAPPAREPRPVVVYSGVAIGLPGSYKASFRDDNFDQLFAGHSLIERLTDGEKQKLVDLRISRLVKSEAGPSFKLLSSLDEVIQLAGKIGRLDLSGDYHIDERDVQNMSTSIAHAVAAGYEALRDAQIPLVREYIRTSSGKLLPQKLALPKEMQEETGVIFANGFPMIDPVIREVSRYISYHMGKKTRDELMAFYQSIIGRVKDDTARKLLSDWYALYYGRLTDSPGEEALYQFNYQLMNQISAQANNRLASLINAKGPNFQMNAACSSTSAAITIAEDFIRSGRVKRMIVIGADDPTSNINLPWLGAGFLCTGAATNEGDLYKAAVPFDLRRNGMIISAGAVGLVLETKEEAERRGVVGICELLGTHAFNTAKDPTQIDPDQSAVEMDKFLTRMEREHGLNRRELAGQLIYLAHETYTPPRGGCAQTEAIALQHAFGDGFTEILVGNTKGMTGHTMGASLEDAVAARALQMGRIPPVVNHSEPDPMLAGLNLAKGGVHERTYALKMSAGFGSQGHLALLKQLASGPNRIADPDRYAAWLREVAGQNEVTLTNHGRLLVLSTDQPVVPTGAPAADEPAPVPPPQAPIPMQATGASAQIASGQKPSAIEVIDFVAQVTQYPPEMLEPEMELEADLGIGGDRRAALVNELAARFGRDAGAAQLGAEATIENLVTWVRQGAASASAGPDAAPQAAMFQPVSVGASRLDRAAIEAETLKVFAEVTKYPEDMLELDMEMEADLGIDTVKQATILSILGEKYRLERDESLQLSNYPTIGHIVDLVYELADRDGQASEEGSIVAPPQQQTAAVLDPQPASSPPEPAAPFGVASPIAVAPEPDREALTADVLQVFAEVTKYPVDMLDLDMEMEADLGIDTVKQATILSLLGEKYRLERDESLQLSNYPTIGHIVGLVYELAGRGGLPPNEPETVAQVEVRIKSEPETAPPPADEGLTRQVVVLCEEPLGPKAYDLKDKTVWVLGENQSVMGQVAAELTGRAAQVRAFHWPEQASEESMAQAVAELLTEGPLDVIIDCSHLGAMIDFYHLAPEEAQEALALNSEARFILYKELATRGARPTRIICLTARDGALGFAPGASQVSDPTYGALAGFYKALRKEWDGTDVRIIDLAPGAIVNPKAWLGHVMAEIEHDGLGIEIAYPEGRRVVAKLDEQEIVPTGRLTFSAADTFLITGGSSGIGAEVALALARRCPARLILNGRVSLPENVAELAALDEAGLDHLRADLMEQLRETHAKVTPALLNKAYDDILKAIDVHRNLEEMRRLGREVVYVSCDITDLARFEAELSLARASLGPITAIVHAAGVERSHLMAQKRVGEFRQVMAAKAIGACHLMHLCREDPLRLVVAFSSISGRFGNAAQLDYSAANGFLNDWVKMIRRARPDVHALSLIWSGWKDVGMAWRNELVRDRSEELGLNLIEIPQGVDAFIREIEHRTPHAEVLLHRGLDGFIEPGLAMTALDGLPLLDRVVKHEGRIARAYRVFSVRRDALIDQHRLGPVPILPAVAYSELAAEFYALQVGPRPRYVVRGLTFENAFKLFREQPRELFIEGQAKDGHAWEIEIKSYFRPPRAMEAREVVHSRATVSDDLPDYADMDPRTWALETEGLQSLAPEESLLLMQNSGPEQRIILGPLYNDVVRDARSKEPVLIYPNSTIYPTYFPQEQLTNGRYPLAKLLTNPCFVDSLYQACAAHLLVNRKRVYLPWEVGELGIVRVPREPGLYRSYTRVVEDAEDVVGFNVVMVDAKGEICYYARHARFRMINL